MKKISTIVMVIFGFEIRIYKMWIRDKKKYILSREKSKK